ncbi:MAG: hypothetical protein J3K34DRAFT_474853 [Monoraphidium minutum]|nr:MAG: hypothetical protein J3K34DRAFT_474853 [Monoraphidium minutum]
MGWISWVVTQVAITSVALGTLKRHNVIQLQPQNIKNDSLRMVVVQALQMGEEINIFAEKLFSGVQEEIQNSKRK